MVGCYNLGQNNWDTCTKLRFFCLFLSWVVCLFVCLFSDIQFPSSPAPPFNIDLGARGVSSVPALMAKIVGPGSSIIYTVAVFYYKIRLHGFPASGTPITNIKFIILCRCNRVLGPGTPITITVYTFKNCHYTETSIVYRVALFHYKKIGLGIQVQERQSRSQCTILICHYTLLEKK